MRTPEEYIADMKSETDLPDFSISSIAYNDQLHADVRCMAATVGVNTDSVGFKASMLLACDLLDHLAACLENTDEEDREIGSAYIQDAARRLRTLSLWGELCHKGTCLDLRT